MYVRVGAGGGAPRVVLLTDRRSIRSSIVPRGRSARRDVN